MAAPGTFNNPANPFKVVGANRFTGSPVTPYGGPLNAIGGLQQNTTIRTGSVPPPAPTSFNRAGGVGGGGGFRAGFGPYETADQLRTEGRLIGSPAAATNSNPDMGVPPGWTGPHSWGQPAAAMPPPAPVGANPPPAPGNAAPANGLQPQPVNPFAGAMPVNSGGAYLPARASGGDVSAGQPTIVGENGPEVMVPQQNGVIIPNLAGNARAAMPPPAPPLRSAGNPAPGPGWDYVARTPDEMTAYNPQAVFSTPWLPKGSNAGWPSGEPLATGGGNDQPGPITDGFTRAAPNNLSEKNAAYKDSPSNPPPAPVDWAPEDEQAMDGAGRQFDAGQYYSGLSAVKANVDAAQARANQVGSALDQMLSGKPAPSVPPPAPGSANTGNSFSGSPSNPSDPTQAFMQKVSTAQDSGLITKEEARTALDSVSRGSPIPTMEQFLEGQINGRRGSMASRPTTTYDSYKPALASNKAGASADAAGLPEDQGRTAANDASVAAGGTRSLYEDGAAPSGPAAAPASSVSVPPPAPGYDPTRATNTIMAGVFGPYANFGSSPSNPPPAPTGSGLPSMRPSMAAPPEGPRSYTPIVPTKVDLDPAVNGNGRAMPIQQNVPNANRHQSYESPLDVWAIASAQGHSTPEVPKDSAAYDQWQKMPAARRRDMISRMRTREGIRWYEQAKAAEGYGMNKSKIDWQKHIDEEGDKADTLKENERFHTMRAENWNAANKQRADYQNQILAGKDFAARGKAQDALDKFNKEERERDDLYNQIQARFDQANAHGNKDAAHFLRIGSQSNTVEGMEAAIAAHDKLFPHEPEAKTIGGQKGVMDAHGGWHPNPQPRALPKGAIPPENFFTHPTGKAGTTPETIGQE